MGCLTEDVLYLNYRDSYYTGYPAVGLEKTKKKVNDLKKKQDVKNKF